MKKYKGYVIKKYPNDYRIYDEKNRFIELGFRSLEDARKYIDVSMYIFDIYKQDGTEPSPKDLWVGARWATYPEIQAEIDQLHADNKGMKFYYIRRKENES